MKRSLSINDAVLQKVFREAFQEKAEQALLQNRPGKAFDIAVMREVQRISRTAAATSRFSWFPDTAWRLAPVACGIVFALTVFLMQVDPAFEYDVAALSLSDPIGFQETNLFSF